MDNTKNRTVPSMQCSGEPVILHEIFYEVSRFPLHSMLYCENLDYFLDSVCGDKSVDVQ